MERACRDAGPVEYGMWSLCAPVRLLYEAHPSILSVVAVVEAGSLGPTT